MNSGQFVHERVKRLAEAMPTPVSLFESTMRKLVVLLFSAVSEPTAGTQEGHEVLDSGPHNRSRPAADDVEVRSRR